MTRALKNRRVAVLVTDSFEKVELTIRGVNLHEPASRVRVTCASDEVSSYDALLVPGGFINPDLLRQSSADVVVPFVRAVLDHFAGADASRHAEQHASISSPQRDAPPAAVVNAMRWMPRPSIRTALGLGVAAVAALAAVSRRAA